PTVTARSRSLARRPRATATPAPAARTSRASRTAASPCTPPAPLLDVLARTALAPARMRCARSPSRRRAPPAHRDCNRSSGRHAGRAARVSTEIANQCDIDQAGRDETRAHRVGLIEAVLDDERAAWLEVRPRRGADAIEECQPVDAAVERDPRLALDL